MQSMDRLAQGVRTLARTGRKLVGYLTDGSRLNRVVGRNENLRRLSSLSGPRFGTL